MKSFSNVGECRPALCYAAAVLALLLADMGRAQQFTAVNISAKPVASALTELAHETGVNVLFSPDAVRGLQSAPVNAKVSPEGAARLLLAGTQLDVLTDSSGALIVRERAGSGGAVPSLAVAAAAQIDPGPVAPPVSQTSSDGDQPSTSMKQQQTQIPSSHREDGLPTAQAPVGLEEIIVTAQKREERLQDVPIAITALSRTQIEARSISNVVDLKSIAPNLLVSLMPNSNVVSQVSLRGGVTINGGLYWEPSTGLYMDGVYLGKAVGSVVDVVELERIEVLRGPQGTLYGRNTMAGAVNFVTRKPSGEFGGMASVELGNYGGHIEKLSLDLPRWGSARLSFAARKEDRDGLVNLTGGGELDSRDKLGVRVALALDFTDSFVADYRFDYTKIDQAPPHNQLYHVTPNSELFTAAASYASRKRLGTVSTNWPGYEQLDLHGHAFTLTWDVNEGNQLKSISARRTLRNNDSVDLDGVPLTITTANRISDLEQRSQELQWVGRIERLDYVLGLYYYEDEGQTINPHVFFFGSDNSQYGFGVEARSAYGQLDWHATDVLTLTAGLRRTKEDKITWRFKSATPAFLGPIPWVRAEASFAATTPLATIAYKVNNRLNIYAKYSEGFKSGGFQGEAGSAEEAVIPYDPEEQKTFEIGAKFTSEDGRLQLNAAVFHNDIENMHVNRFTGLPGVSVIRNAGQATTKGFELEGSWIPADALRLSASYGYLDGGYDEFMEAVAPGQPITNVADNRSFPHAPKHTFNVNVDARLTQTGWGELRGLVDYGYTASFYAYPYQLVTVDPTRATAGNTKVESCGLLNLRLALTDMPVGGPGQAEVALWVRNAADENQPVNFIDFGPGFFADYTLAYYPEPRTYGATFTYRW